MTHRLNSMQAHPSRFKGHGYQPRHTPTQANPNKATKLGYAVTKVTAVAAASAAAILALAGCSKTDDLDITPQTREHNVKLEDGSEVTCIMFDEFDTTKEDSYAPGSFQLQAVDCDWAHRRAGVDAKPETKDLPREVPTITLTPEPSDQENPEA